jgi:pimeloyl-ACP methyl ester carboxylesterase
LVSAVIGRDIPENRTSLDTAERRPGRIVANVTRSVVSPPPPGYFAMEPLALMEFNAFLGTMPFLRLMPHGKGQPVLVLPGFTGSDRSTRPLRWVLRRWGFSVHGWLLGANTGPHPHIVDGMVARLDELRRRYGTEVTVVGWSLGGIYARELARRHPDAVRQVITLGSPFRLRAGDRSSASWLYDRIGPQDDPMVHLPEEAERPSLTVPATAIYTRTDGIVRWHACIESTGPQRENIEVVGTHSGLGTNVGAVVAILDRLAQPEGSWRPFRVPPALRHLYRRPAQWREPRSPARAEA